MEKLIVYPAFGGIKDDLTLWGGAVNHVDFDTFERGVVNAFHANSQRDGEGDESYCYAAVLEDQQFGTIPVRGGVRKETQKAQ